MEQQLDFEFLNFDRELGDLRDAAANLQNSLAEFGPALCAYIEALNTLNAHMMGRLEPFLRRLRDSGEVRQSLREPREWSKCQRAAAHSGAARDTVHPHPHQSQTGEATRPVGVHSRLGWACAHAQKGRRSF